MLGLFFQISFPPFFVCVGGGDGVHLGSIFVDMVYVQHLDKLGLNYLDFA